MTFLRLVWIVSLVLTVSCQRSSNPNPSASKIASETVTSGQVKRFAVDGREETPGETKVPSVLGDNLMSQMIAEAINEIVPKLHEKLEISGPIETALLSMPYGHATSDGDLTSIHLFRPADEIEAPRTIVLSHDGTPGIRFTRMAAPVTHPLAIMTATSMSAGHLTQTETVFVYIRGKWKRYIPTEQQASLNSTGSDTVERSTQHQ